MVLKLIGLPGKYTAGRPVNKNTDVRLTDFQKFAKNTDYTEENRL